MRAAKLRVKQWARRVPAIRVARHALVREVRRSKSMRALATRVFAVGEPTTAPPDVASGRVLGGVGTESLPVVLVVALGAETEMVSDSVDEVARIQLLSAGFRPVIVTDTPAFSAARRYGYPAEMLVDRKSWVSGDYGDRTWEEYARERLALLFATYRATASVTVRPTGLDDSARVVLNALRPAAVEAD